LFHRSTLIQTTEKARSASRVRAYRWSLGAVNFNLVARERPMLSSNVSCFHGCRDHRRHRFAICCRQQYRVTGRTNDDLRLEHVEARDLRQAANIASWSRLPANAGIRRRGAGDRWRADGSEAAESDTGPGLRNLTSAPMTQVYMSPAGQDTFGPDQIALVPGGEVGHDKILELAGIAPGRYLTESHRQHRACLLGAQRHTGSQSGGFPAG
jgi:hypothetical protein